MPIGRLKRRGIFNKYYFTICLKNFFTLEKCFISNFSLHNEMKQILSILILFSTLFGWGNTGHRIVGKVAEDRLSNKAKRQIKNIIGHHDLAYISIWADRIKSDPNWNHAYDWHWATIPDGEVYEIGKHSGKLVDKINEFSKNANSADMSLEEKKRAIKWLIHLVGDLHQPLHVGNGKDRGGNDIKVKWFGEDTNLHEVWDEKLIEHQNLSYTEYAHFLNLEFNESECIKWLVKDFEFYANESKKYRNVCYNFETNNLTYNYLFVTKPILDMRLMQAGVRLADLFNNIFH